MYARIERYRLIYIYIYINVSSNICSTLSIHLPIQSYVPINLVVKWAVVSIRPPYKLCSCF